MAGFFKVPHELYRALVRDPNTLRVYLELASRARWAAGSCLGSHGIVALAVGQCILGRAELAAALGLSERNVRTSIERLNALGCLTIETTKRGTVVTLTDDSGSTEERPSERPSLDSPNDQASTHQLTIGATTNEDPRREDPKKEDQRERRKPARRVPATWNPRPEDKILDGQQLVDGLADFRDHEYSKPRSDWDACWRTWQRNVLRFERERAPAARQRSLIGSAAPRSDHPETGLVDFGAIA